MGGLAAAGRAPPPFWALIGASVVPPLLVTGLSFNQVAIFTDRGLPGTLAAITVTVEPLVGLPVTLLAGMLPDRVLFLALPTAATVAVFLAHPPRPLPSTRLVAAVE